MMAVYTDVDEQDLGRFIAAYDVGRLVSCKGIAEGVENSNFLITTSNDTYILTLYEKRVARADLPFFVKLMHHLAGSGINCPTPLQNNQGEMLGELSGRPAALISFLEGLSIRRPQPNHCRAVGAALAELHRAGARFTMSRKNDLALEGWRKLAGELGSDGDHIIAGLSDLIAAELEDLASQWPHALPGGVIHADLFPDNVFFLGDTLSGIIDFYFACNDAYVYDLAICLNAWCFEADNAFNITKARGLLRGYSGVRHLEDAEFHALPLMARGAALRFLLTRALDWLHTSDTALVRPKDPLEYLQKLRFHQRVQSARDYGLGEGE